MAVKKKIIRTVKAKKKKPSLKKKIASKESVKLPTKKTTPLLKLQVIGKISHFFPHVSAGVIKLTGDLKKGDIINIKGHTTDLKQAISSMQLDHVTVTEAKKGQEIGLKVKERVRIGDTVYKL